MQYKRDESFRYIFNSPIEGTIKILLEKNGELFQTKTATITLLDLSPGGLKFQTNLDLPIERKDFSLEIHFSLVQDMDLMMLGKIVWKKIQASHYLYGFEAFEDKQTEDAVITGLKAYRKQLNSGTD